MLSMVLGTIPINPLDGIGATPRNEMEKKFNMSDMHLPSKHKVKAEDSSWKLKDFNKFPSASISRASQDQCRRLSRYPTT